MTCFYFDECSSSHGQLKIGDTRSDTIWKENIDIKITVKNTIEFACFGTTNDDTNDGTIFTQDWSITDGFGNSFLDEIKGGEIIQKENLFCKKAGRGKKYSSLKQAQNKCKQKISCLAVQDRRCDGKGSFVLCFGVENISKAAGSLNTCIYKKMRHL